MEEGNEDLRDQLKDMGTIEKMFTIDHDFVCISKQRNNDCENAFVTGLRGYIDGDWQYA